MTLEKCWDDYLERRLDEHLAEREDAEEVVLHVSEDSSAQFIEDNLFERKDGSRFRVTSWPEKEQDYDRDEETGRPYPCGWTWSRYETEEATN